MNFFAVDIRGGRELQPEAVFKAGIGGGMGSITPEQNVVGTLIVDLCDSKNKSLVWRGLEDTLNNNGNKNQQLVQKAITKMFKQWPK